MQVICPICHREYHLKLAFKIDREVTVRCKNCKTRFKVTRQSNGHRVCPNCGFKGAEGAECANCGIIFEKYVEHEKHGANNTEIGPENSDSGRKKINQILMSWVYVSVFYVLIVTIFSIVVFQTNDRYRPKRDRLYATIDFVEYSRFKEEVEWIKDTVDDMIDARDRKSKIYDHIEHHCKRLEWDVKIWKANAKIQATFRNGLVLKYVNMNSAVYIKEPNIPGKQYFTIFPKFSELQFNDRGNDYDGMVSELHWENDDLDFAIIEYKFRQSMKWHVTGFIIFSFLLWAIPVSLSFLAVCFISRTRIA